MKFGGSKCRPGASVVIWGGRGGARRWRTAVAKRVIQRGRQHRPYSYHRQSFGSSTHKTGGGYWIHSDEFCEHSLL